VIHLFRRIGFLGRRGVLTFVILAVAGIAAYWLVPWRGARPDLRLVALTAEGAFDDSVRVTEAPAPARTMGGMFAVPLVLAVANAGQQPARPARLELLVPPSVRLVDRQGLLRAYRGPGEPLVRYVLPGPFPPIEGGRVPTVLPAVDTLWLEPVLRTHYCVVGPDSIPDLVAAPAPDPSQDGVVRIFYSFEGGNLERRQPGLLDVVLPGQLLARPETPPVPDGVVTVRRPQAERPDLGALTLEGTRTAECGGPGEPVELFTATWRTAGQGRFMVVHYGGVPRKHYLDLNADSVLELEMWDPDGDGRFEASRPTRIPIPEFLLPAPEPAPDTLLPDSLRVDSARIDTAGIRPDSARQPWFAPPPAQRADPGLPPAGQQPGQAAAPADQPQPAAAQPEPEPVQPEPVEPEPEPEPQPRQPAPPLGDPLR